MKVDTITLAGVHNLDDEGFFERVGAIVEKYEFKWVVIFLTFISIFAFLHFYSNGLGLAYNDARSHLDIGRRTVEGLKTGLAQLGSVWLPLPHFLMIFTVWNDFMWHSGLSGALVSMVSYVGCGIFIWKILKQLEVSLIGRLIGVFVFAGNANVLYLQSTAMTELLLLFSMTAAFYELILWHKSENVWDLVKASFWIMISTLTRYEGWFIFLVALLLVTFHVYIRRGFKVAEGIFLLMLTLSGLGIFLWFVWNLLIFKDLLYSFLGPYSAHAQQQQIFEAGELITKWNIFNSIKIYFLSLYYTIGIFTLLLSSLGMIFLFLDKRLSKFLRGTIIVLLVSPLIYNVLALFFGFSIISIVHVFGDNWFNVRYGLMMVPSVAICIGYLLQKARFLKYLIVPMIMIVFVKSYFSEIPVTIQDALWGASSKNVTQVSGFLRKHASSNEDKIFISAGSHDAIIFTSGLKMNRFIHEGTGTYWEMAGESPDRFARYIVMRTYDMKDSTFYSLRNSDLSRYRLVLKGEFADVYELKDEYRASLINPKFMRPLNGNNVPYGENGLFVGEKILRNIFGQASVFGYGSMFAIVSASLLLTKVDKRKIRLKGKIDGEFGFNLNILRWAKKMGLFT